MLETFRSELGGLVQSARAQVRIQLAERAAEQEQWVRQTDHLMELARAATEFNLSGHAWRDLLATILASALRADSVERLSEIFERYMWLGWSGDTPRHQPWSLSRQLAIAQDLGHARAGAHTGELIMRNYPGCALGPYTCAHFREVAALAKGAATLPAHTARVTVKHFERAHTEATHAGRDALARHCRLRASVTRMLGGFETRQARAALKAVLPADLTPKERLWWMLGMHRSTFWLDRVRAADVLDEIASDVARARPTEAQRQLNESTVHMCVEYLLGHDEAELHPSEEDRLRGVVDVAFGHTDPARAKRLLSTLQMRQEVQDTAQTSLRDADDLIASLEDRASAHGDGWAKTAQTMRALQRVLDDACADAEVPAPPRKPLGDWLVGAHRAHELLWALRMDQPSEIEQAVLTLRRTLQEDASAWPAAWLRPLASAWPMLIAWVRDNAPPERRRAAGGGEEAKDGEDAHQEEEERRERRAYIVEVGIGAIKIWAAHAPRPSYGWWGLAEHLLDADMAAAADAVATRALSDHVAPEDAQQRAVVGKLTAWAVEGGDRPTMLRWLEIAQNLEQASA